MDNNLINEQKAYKFGLRAKKAPPVVVVKKLPKAYSVGEETLAQHLMAYNIPFSREYHFHPEKKWRFDFILNLTDRPDLIAIEIEGGIWTKGGHNTGYGMLKDMAKYNEAQRLGWKVYRFSTQHVTSGFAIDYIRQVIA